MVFIPEICSIQFLHKFMAEIRKRTNFFQKFFTKQADTVIISVLECESRTRRGITQSQKRGAAEHNAIAKAVMEV